MSFPAELCGKPWVPRVLFAKVETLEVCGEVWEILASLFINLLASVVFRYLFLFIFNLKCIFIFQVEGQSCYWTWSLSAWNIFDFVTITVSEWLGDLFLDSIIDDVDLTGELRELEELIVLDNVNFRCLITPLKHYWILTWRLENFNAIRKLEFIVLFIIHINGAVIIRRGLWLGLGDICLESLVFEG